MEPNYFNRKKKAGIRQEILYLLPSSKYFQMKKLILILVIISGLCIEGCKKDFLTSLAVNPNSPSQSSPQLVLPTALQSTGAMLNGSTFSKEAIWFGYWNYSGSYSIGQNSLNYFESTTTDNGMWFGLYYNAYNYNYIEKTAKSLPHNQYFEAIAKIMKSLDFAYLVDIFNDVPYTHAFDPNNFLPKYDKAQTIYESCVQQLDSAMYIIKAADALTINPQSSDIVFGGNMQLWASFANTVKLRMLLRQSEMPGRQAYIQGEIALTKDVPYLGQGQSALSNPGYSNSADNKQTPIWQSYGLSSGGSLVSDGYAFMRGGGYGLSFCKKTNDPRLIYFYAPLGTDPTSSTFSTPDPDTSHYNAAFFGDKNTLPNSNTSGLGLGVLQGYKAPAVIMLSAESLFLQAEAALKGWIGGDPKTFYQQGITESFAYLGDANAAADAQTYYSQNMNDVSYTASTNKLEAIITQKWMALNGISNFEAWCDWRRLGLPKVPHSLEPTSIGKHIPYRLYYPQDEYNKNATNVNAEGTVTSENKIFWMP